MFLTPRASNKVRRNAISTVDVELVVEKMMFPRLISSTNMQFIEKDGMVGLISSINANVFAVIKANGRNFPGIVFEMVTLAIIAQRLCQPESGYFID